MGLENELAYEREIRELREENARLKAEWEMPCQRCEGYRNERDEARAKLEKVVEVLPDLLSYVYQLELLAYPTSDGGTHLIVERAQIALAAAKGE